jgi:hypothetical protein
MGALNLPSAADLERLTRRLRSVSQRLEGIEDGLDRIDDRVRSLGQGPSVEERLAAIERSVETIAAEVTALRRSLPEPTEPLSREQERIPVEDA